MGLAPTSTQLGVRLTTILDLPARIEALRGPMRERADRLVSARLVHGRTEPPAELESWIELTFGSLAAVRDQAVLKVSNPATLESTIFAPLRARRPLDGYGHAQRLADEISATDDDPFCHPSTGTPAEPFGRISGRRVLTGANAAMADGHHAVLVFDRHDPLAFDADLVRDLLDTARAWADRSRADDPAATNYLLIWNCLWRAGGSIVHGHAQALLGTGAHYEQLERLRRDVDAYHVQHAEDFVEDLVAVHRSLGLVIDMADGVSLLANLTPRKERELMLVGSAGMEETDPRFAGALGRVIEKYRDRIGVRSFNLALWRPPLGHAPGWEGFPPMARIVDRGDPFARPSDIGAMELYGTPIVSSDPFALIEQLR